MTKKQFNIDYYYKKDLYKLLDYFAISLLNAGVIFFSIEMKMFVPNNDSSGIDLVYDDESCRKYISNFLWSLRLIDFIDCCFGSIEIDFSGVPCINCIVGFRVPENMRPFIRQKIDGQLIYTSMVDYKLSQLYKFKHVTQFLCYLSKDFHKERPLNFTFHCAYSELNCKIHYDFRDYVDTPYYSCLSEKTQMIFFGPEMVDCYQYIPTGRHSKFSGLPASLQKDKIAHIIYYLNHFLLFREYIIYKGYLYKKIKGSLISYEYISGVETIKENFVHYMNDLKENFFDFIDPTALFIIFSVNSDKIIESVSLISSFSQLSLNLDILEFKDGLYFTGLDKFVSKEDKTQMDLLCNKFFVIKYHAYDYAVDLQLKKAS